jgi:hypothetical protein
MKGFMVYCDYEKVGYVDYTWKPFARELPEGSGRVYYCVNCPRNEFGLIGLSLCGLLLLMFSSLF